MTKIVRLICVLLLVTSLFALASCELLEVPDDDTSSDEKPQTPETPADSETVTVTFDTDGGSAVASKTVEKGEKVQKPEDPKKDGYVFDGWYVDDEKWSFIGYVVTDDITLTAKWIEGVTVTFSLPDFLGTTIQSVTVLPYSKIESPQIPEICELHKFRGWFLPDGSEWSFADDKVVQDITLFAEYYSPVTVSFVDNEGQRLFPSQTIVYGSKASNPGVPKGYEIERFLGWFDGNNFWDFDRALYSDLTLSACISDDGYDWPSGTEIIVQLGMHSNGGELSSGCRRYYAGEDNTASKEVDKSVKDRNKAAETWTKVDVKYSYVGTTDSATDYSWSGAAKQIQTDATSPASTTKPDIYVNFAYSLTCAQIRNCFANLLDTSGEVFTKGNHFTFVKDYYNPVIEDYFDSNAGGGYFYAYMQSLSLTPDTRLYCIGSNYTLDLVRAFYVIPVNVDLMGEITDVDTAPAGDQDGDGDHDIKDFYKLVNNGQYGWNYDALAEYAGLISSTSGGSNTNADIQDERVGLILGQSSGLTGSGILYTTDVEILKWDAAAGKYTYPSTASKLESLTESLFELMENNKNSICTVTKDQAKELGLIKDNESELVAIRDKFADGGVLFGGIICVGSLEDQAYQGMRGEGKNGFGVVPVPVFREGEKYLTSVHNLARIAAISKNSTEKSECSAFLDYQSTHSATILEDYYTNTLTASTGGLAGNENAQMLNYIRNHVRTCFDKTFEDAIATYILEDDENALHDRWHQYIMDQGYAVTGMSITYTEQFPIKQKNLDVIYGQWNRLKAAI